MSSSVAFPLCVLFLFWTSLACAAIMAQCVFPPTGKYLALPSSPDTKTSTWRHCQVLRQGFATPSRTCPLKDCPPWMTPLFDPAADPMIFLHWSTNMAMRPKSNDKARSAWWSCFKRLEAVLLIELWIQALGLSSSLGISQNYSWQLHFELQKIIRGWLWHPNEFV